MTGGNHRRLPAQPKSCTRTIPTRFVADLKHQSVDATVGHAQGDGTRPTPDGAATEIVNFEMALSTAQAIGNHIGPLDAQGANGGPRPLVTQPFFISINSSVHFLLPQFEQPGGLVTPGDGQFTPRSSIPLTHGRHLPYGDPRAAVARGQAIFNSKPINITGVAGINDDVVGRRSGCWRHSLASGNLRHLPRYAERRQSFLPDALEHRDRRSRALPTHLSTWEAWISATCRTSRCAKRTRSRDRRRASARPRPISARP